MDNLIVNFRPRVQKNVVILLKRQLNLHEGNIRVRVGQEVHPEDILGEGRPLSGFRTINVAGYALKKKIGQNIYKGELLAVKERMLGLNHQIILAPTDGIIESFGDKGLLKIRLASKSIKLVSGVLGIVDYIDTKLGIVSIRTMANLINGILGTGIEREGVLNILGSSDSLISSKYIKTNQEKQILVGGSIVFMDGLKQAVDMGVSGIISGGINAKDYKTMAGGGWGKDPTRWVDVGLSVIITEGFGSVLMGEDIFSLLNSHNGQFAIIDGNKKLIILPKYDSEAMIYIRKVKIPENSTLGFGDLESSDLKIGSMVRVISQDLLGIEGKVIQIDQKPSQLPSGIKTYLVTLESQKRKIRVPYSNVEII